LLLTSYKALTNFVPSSLSPCIDEIAVISDGFGNRLTTNQIYFFTLQALEERWQYNEKVHQISIDFMKAYALS
jgi:hypothetical protein